MYYADRVKQTTTTTGTGAYSISAVALPGYATWAAAIPDGSQTGYCVQSITDYEVGLGTYNSTSNSLSRDSILASSNSGAAVDWAAGSKDVFVTVPASTVAALHTEPLLATLRSGLLSLLDGTVDGSGNPIDRTGSFTWVKDGSLTTTTLTDGPWQGRTGFVLNGTDATAYASDEELRLTGAMTLVFAGKLDAAANPSTTDYVLASCTAAGETSATNALFIIKHAYSNNGCWASFHEYGNGSNSSGVQHPPAPAKDVWYYVAASRSDGGKQVDISTWTPAGWSHDYILHSSAPAKNTSGNEQVLGMCGEYPTSSSVLYHGLCAGVALYNRALSRSERIVLKDVFFQL